jgi:predicted methyltransferase
VDPIPLLTEFVAARRPVGRPLRELVALLTGEPLDLAALIRRTALPRRTVEAVLGIVEPDLVRVGDAVALGPARAPEYEAAFGLARLARTRLVDPLAGRLAEAAPLLATLTEMIEGAPPAKVHLDHVPATPETVLRRALWLDGTYDLDGSVVACVGDHDLTSLAIALVNPGATPVVIDVDEATLAYVDASAARLGLPVRCLHADLRFGPPQRAIGMAHLVFTDPPYTPEGVALFTACGLSCLTDREHGRVVVAYGYSDLHPALGARAQAVTHRLGLAWEAMLPHFNRYNGAQAVGSAADLHVWRPTAQTWRSLGRATADVGLYTRGAHAVEHTTGAAAGIPAAVREAAGEVPAGVVTGPSGGWHDESVQRIRLETLFGDGIARRGRYAVLADLAEDQGPWLLRVLLAVNAERVVAMVRNGHPDIATEAAQRDLAGILGPKYRLRHLRSRPDPGHALVVADAVVADVAVADVAVADAAGADTAGERSIAAFLLGRAHGKTGNAWRDGLIAAEPGLTKRAARAAVDAAASRPEILDTRLLDLPRHQIAGLLADVRP